MLATAFLVGPWFPTESARAGDPPVVRQLRSLGYEISELPPGARLADALAEAPPGRVAIVDRRYVGHLHVLRRVLDDGRYDASSGPGAVAVSTRSRPELVAVTRTTEDRVESADRATVDVAELSEALAARTELNRVDPAPLVAGIATDTADQEALQRRVDAIDEEKVRLRAAVKSDDTMFTTFAVRSYSGYVARWLARLGVTPNQATVFSLLVGLGAAAVCTTGTRTGYVVGALLFHISFALDCIDGDLARYTLRFSRLGSFLDATFDRLKEYALYAGLAIGAMRTDIDVWWLAAAAMALQTVRHQMHFAYEEVTVGPGEAPPLSAELQTRLTGSRWKVWLRRAAVLPQGERSALLCLLIIFTDPRITFIVMLSVGLLAGAYGFAGRLLRSLKRLHRGWSRRAARSLGAMVDVGPIGWIVHHALPGRSLPAPLTTLIALAVLSAGFTTLPSYDGSWLWVGALWYVLLVSFASRQPLNGWADWVLPPSFRAAEYALVILAAGVIEPAAVPAAFGYVFACAYHHYDTVYRLRGAGTPPPRWLAIVSGGHDGRIAVLALLALGGGTVLTIGLVVLAVYLAALYVGESVASTASWMRAATSVPEATEHEELRAPDETGEPAPARNAERDHEL